MHPSFTVFGTLMSSYAACIAVGAVLGVLLAIFVTRRRYSFNEIDYTTLLVWAFIPSMVGAKLLFFIVELKTFLAHPEMFVTFLRGGSVFLGGVLGALIGVFFGTRRFRWNYIKALDTMIPPICLAHALGRVGCFLGGCCYGRETDSIFGVIYPEGSPAPAGVKLLPTQLFETCFLLIWCAVTMVILLRKKQDSYVSKPGHTLSAYLIGYGAWRFFLEFFRNDRRGSVGALTTSQFISCFLIAGGILLLIFRKPVVSFFEKICVQRKPGKSELRKAKKS